MTKLRILLRNYADFENALAEEARLFEAEHSGVKVDLVSVGIHELYNTGIADGGLRQGDFDLALLVTDWLAEGIATGTLEDLQLWQQRTPIADWPDGWPRSLVRPLYFGEKLSSLPWHDGPECLVYRTDLFGSQQIQAAFRAQFDHDLAPPTTWQQFEETARFFTGRKENLYGIVFAAFPDGHNTLYDFALQVWSRGGELVESTGQPQLVSDQSIAALNFYRRIVRDPEMCHPQSPHLDSTQSGDLFLKGEVAMMANWFGFATRSSAPGAPLEGKVAIAPIPTAQGCAPVSLSVFWALAMGAGSRHKETAWEFLRFVAEPECDLGIIRHGPVGVRLSTWRNPELQAQIPVYRGVEEISLGARQLPRGPQMAAFAAIIDSVVTRALNTSDDTTAILEAAQNEVDHAQLRFQ